MTERREKPKRIQRKRSAGWRMPEGVVYVGRPTKWGNPHKVGVSLARNNDGTYRYMSAEDAVDAYKEVIGYWAFGVRDDKRLNLEELRGKDLACWCRLDQPCHADVLLELANADVMRLDGARV